MRTLHCPNCGAAAQLEQTHCNYCEAQFATIACPQCLNTAFVGDRHCDQCGSLLERSRRTATRTLHCSNCEQELIAFDVGGLELNECESCAGVWLERSDFLQICEQIEARQQLGVHLRQLSKLQRNQTRPPSRRYRPCAECSELMTTFHFARESGVTLDVCPRHGLWFDAMELQQIVAFLHTGLGVTTWREQWERLMSQRVFTTTPRPSLTADRSSLAAGEQLSSQTWLDWLREVLEFLLKKTL